ncbi:MAG: hypothetical protein HC917_14490, partial [Richelia sp. SM2_1_7]|nr:hypothetical protein [Richelia sp. SM2_1_7]
SEAIAYAHAQGKRIGGNEPEKALLKEADFMAVYDGRSIDLDLREDISKLIADNAQLTVLFQINNDSNRSTDDTVHTFIKNGKPTTGQNTSKGLHVTKTLGNTG